MAIAGCRGPSAGQTARASVTCVFTDRSERPKPRPQVQRPDSITIDDTGAVFTLTRRWYSFGAWFLLFFAAFWNGALVLFISSILSGPAPKPVLLFGSLHIAVGLFVGYAAICMFLNRTDVSVDGQRLRVRHHPMPWPGQVELDTADVRQLWVKERISRGKTTSYSYQLHARLPNGSSKQVLSGLATPELAFFFEQQLEGRLGLEDEAVDGEMAR
ncbi:MAG: hypothetical protein JST92_16465 [Deltaproteobacteria bacterium]|nr:hypothetical protein [Deltaproteobacteria bacterium]